MVTALTYKTGCGNKPAFRSYSANERFPYSAREYYTD